MTEARAWCQTHTETEIQKINPAIDLKPSSMKGIVLLIHGMMEHSGRYHSIAQFLYDHGYRVMMCDSNNYLHTVH